MAQFTYLAPGPTPTVVGVVGSHVSTAVSLAVAFPSGTTLVGELLLIGIVGGNGGYTTPSGWTALYSSSNFAVFWKTATGSEGASVTITSAGSSAQAALCYRINGWFSPPEIATTASTATGAASVNLDPPNLAPTWTTQNTLWIALMLVQVPTLTFTFNTYPSGYSNTLNAQDNAFSIIFVCAAAGQLASAAASENPGPFNISTTASAAIVYVTATIGIKPLG